MAIADRNEIPRTTLYRRISSGWDLERAISEPPKRANNKKRKRNEDGIFVDTGKGKQRGFTIPEEWEPVLEQAVADSGLTQSEWVGKVIVDKLKRSKYAKLKSAS